ncbi:MAG: peptidoglycan DD-metalloendopeptidase family protein [Bacteroidota bacterium]
MLFIFIAAVVLACKNEPGNEEDKTAITHEEKVPEKPVEVIEFGFNLDNYLIKKDTIKAGDTFGAILTRHNIGHRKIYEITEKTKDSFNVRRLRAGNSYAMLFTKDSLQEPQYFIYQPNNIDYVVVNVTDSIHAYTESKPVKIIEREASGIITHSLYKTLHDQGLEDGLVWHMENIYAWTVDFFRLQEGDRFKILYTEKYVDGQPEGIDKIHAAYFEHRGTPIYAFEFKTDSIKGTTDYFDANAKNLRRAFLKAPVKFSRISSRYNLKRRIAYYGYKVRPHRGTDFAANIGTPIMATANGVVTESARRGGNGNYVKIKHNSVYSTQYLHMQKRNVKPGDYVRQGDVIGWVGMTGNTAGPHVCYRFWKNGKEVDPFLQKLPESEPISDSLKAKYLEYIEPLKIQLDCIPYTEEEFIALN